MNGRGTSDAWRSFSTDELPGNTQRSIAALLDSSHYRNWKDILALMPEYGAVHAQQLSREKSPTLSLLRHMRSTGRNLGDLYDFANQLEMKRVCELIIDGLKSKGVRLDGTPRNQGTFPPSPRPPSSPSAVKEAYLRYELSSPTSPMQPPIFHPSLAPPTSSSQSSPSHTTPSTSHYFTVPYSTLAERTRGFENKMINEGGHKLGQGGYGEVFYCKLTLNSQEHKVAIKAFTSKTGQETRRQFESELKIISRLDHAHLLPLLGYSSDGERLCLIYPYMSLGSLDRHIASHQFEANQRVAILRDIASALDYLHTGNETVLVHRDVKSANILIDQNWRGKLTDLGVARSMELGLHTTSTQTIVGTRIYMAPEYCTGLVSPAADVYSLGVVMLELLFGCTAQVSPPGVHPSLSNIDLISFIDECSSTSRYYVPVWSEKRGRLIEQLSESCLNSRLERPTMETIFQSLQTF